MLINCYRCGLKNHSLSPPPSQLQGWPRSGPGSSLADQINFCLISLAQSSFLSGLVLSPIIPPPSPPHPSVFPRTLSHARPLFSSFPCPFFSPLCRVASLGHPQPTATQKGFVCRCLPFFFFPLTLSHAAVPVDESGPGIVRIAPLVPLPDGRPTPACSLFRPNLLVTPSGRHPTFQ